MPFWQNLKDIVKISVDKTEREEQRKCLFQSCYELKSNKNRVFNWLTDSSSSSSCRAASTISLILSRHFSLSFITSGRSSGLHPGSSHSCCMYVRAGHPAFARPYAGVHRSTSLMSSSLLLQQCPACLVRLTWIVFVMGGRWPYSWCLVGCCHQDLFQYCSQQSCVIAV